MLNSQFYNSADTKSNLSSFNQTDNQPPLILIVENNADNRYLLKFMLEMWGYRVVEAEDGFAAIGKARRMKPKLILMDVILPKMNGFDTARRIREFASADAMPIIYLSAYIRSFAEDDGNDFLMKPIDTEKLQSLLTDYIRNQV